MGDDDIYRQAVKQRTPLNQALCAIWYRLWELTGFSTGGTPASAGGILIRYPTVTRHSILLDSGGTAAQIIPTGAKGYGFTVITGTASDGTASGLPVGFSQSDPNTLAAGFTVTASGGTTFVYFNT